MALTNKLSAIGNAIREKTGGTDLLTLDQMATEISNIQGGGTVEELTITSNGTYNPPTGIDGYAPVVVNVPQDGSPPESAFVLTGDCENKFYGGGWDWFINNYGNQITTSDITSTQAMFCRSKVSSVPFELNCKYDTFARCQEMFYGASQMTKAPRINIVNSDWVATIPHLSYMFKDCNSLKEIDYDYFSHWFSEEQWEQINNGSGDNNCRGIFSGCYSLRKHPDISVINSTYAYIGLYYELFQECYCLDEILDLPVWNATLTYNQFDNAFYIVLRVKNLTFKTNSDGTPKTANWQDQYIDLTRYFGYVYSSFKSSVLRFGEATGITADKEVKDDATYQALKDDPNYWTMDIKYSRYNHDSAVRTINSLPDTSAYLTANGGTNTIKFIGNAGALTDGGAINTLTEEEIAVATAKGWSVALV